MDSDANRQRCDFNGGVLVEMNTLRLIVMITILFGLQLVVALVTYLENRMRPLLLKVHLLRDDLEELHGYAKHYADVHSVAPPPELLVPPESQICKHMRMLKVRVGVEMTLLMFLASLPSGAVVLSMG